MPEKTVHDFTARTILGREIRLSEFKGKVLLLVNVASKCGFTPQYKGLEALYEKYKDRGFVVLGFPANDFLSQEPGTNEEIKEFCEVNFGVTFPLFAKISVKGEKIDPLYAFLTDKAVHPETGGKITWNFNKFLADRDGKVVARFDSKVSPEDDKLVSTVERALAR